MSDCWSGYRNPRADPPTVPAQDSLPSSVSGAAGAISIILFLMALSDSSVNDGPVPSVDVLVSAAPTRGVRGLVGERSSPRDVLTTLWRHLNQAIPPHQDQVVPCQRIEYRVSLIRTGNDGVKIGVEESQGDWTGGRSYVVQNQLSRTDQIAI